MDPRNPSVNPLLLLCFRITPATISHRGEESVHNTEQGVQDDCRALRAYSKRSPPNEQQVLRLSRCFSYHTHTTQLELESSAGSRPCLVYQ